MNWFQKKVASMAGLNELVEKAQKVATMSWLVDAANWRERFRRPLQPWTVNTSSIEVNQYDWLTLLSDSRKLYCNLGPVTGMVDDKATYSIGRAWNPVFLGDDKAWGEKAKQWLQEIWYPMADARGGMFDFKTDLWLSSVSIDRDGEIYILLTESKDGFPLIQLLPAHMIGQRDNQEGILVDGPYKGLMMRQGCITNDVGRTVAFNVLGATPEEDSQVSARDLIQLFDPKWCDQLRGWPAFTHALLDLGDVRTLQGYEKMAAFQAGRVGLIEKNPMGAPDPNDPKNALTYVPSITPGVVPTVVTQQFTGGEAVFFQSGTGSGLEVLKNDRPGQAWDAFMDRLIRNASAGASWPFELTWDSSKLGGANVRLLLAKAMRSVEDRQDLIRPPARRILGYACAKAIKLKQLPESGDWYKWGFSMPARMTADYGRDANADRADYLAGITNLTDILEEEGRNLAQHIKTRKEENEALAAAGLTPPPTGNPPAK